MKRLLIFLCLLTLSLQASYETGKEIFKNKCSSCHGSYIPMSELKTNFFEHDNEVLKLTAPTENMIVYALIDGSRRIGDKNDPEMQRFEIATYLTDYLYHPKIQNTICERDIIKYYVKKESMRGLVSEEEITELTDFFMEYKKERRKTHPKKKKPELTATNDMSAILEQAKNENKIILIEAMSQDCHYCKVMEEEVISQEDVQTALAKDFIFVVVDIHELKLPFGLDKKYQGMTPTFFTVDSDGKLLHEYPGSWTKKDFFEIMGENVNK